MLNLLRPTPNGKAKPIDPHLFSETHVKDRRRAVSWLEDRVAKAQNGPIHEIAELTPALAELLLTRNESNRAVSAMHIATLATDMREGAWELNGESLKISVEGALNDGQHRCHAVIAAGRSIRTVFIFGVARQSRLTLDQGKVRTVGDYLGMEGVENANSVAAVARMLWQFTKFGSIGKMPRLRPTKAQNQEIARLSGDDIAFSLSVVPVRGALLAGGRSLLAFCHFQFAKIDRQAADAFIQRLVRGDGLASNDPIYYCRERLHQNKRMILGEKAELIFRAWNAHRRGKRLTKLLLNGSFPRLER